MGPAFDIRQSQSLVLTPQLAQAIKLLQLSNLELEACIAEELAKNPLLEARQRRRGDERCRCARIAMTAGDGDDAPTTGRATS